MNDCNKEILNCPFDKYPCEKYTDYMVAFKKLIGQLSKDNINRTVVCSEGCGYSNENDCIRYKQYERIVELEKQLVLYQQRHK